MDIEYQVNKLINSKSGVDGWLDYITKLKQNHIDGTLLTQVYTYAVNSLVKEPSIGYKKILIGLANLQSGSSVEKARELYLDAKGVDYECAVVRVYHAQFEYLHQNKMEALQILTHAKKAGCQPRSLIKKAFRNCKSNKSSLFVGIGDPWDKALSDETGGDTQTNTFPIGNIEEVGSQGLDGKPANNTVQKLAEPRLKLCSGPVRSVKKINKTTCVTPCANNARFKRNILCDNDSGVCINSHSEVFQRRGPTMSPFTRVKYSPLVKRNMDNIFSTSNERSIFEVSIAQRTPISMSSKSHSNSSGEKDDAYGSGSSNSSAIPSKDALRRMLLSPCSYSPYSRNVSNIHSNTKSSVSSRDNSDGNSEYENNPEKVQDIVQDCGSILEERSKDVTTEMELKSLKECSLGNSKDNYIESSKSNTTLENKELFKSSASDTKSLTPNTDLCMSSTDNSATNSESDSIRVHCKTESNSKIAVNSCNNNRNCTIRDHQSSDINSKVAKCRKNRETNTTKDLSLKININKRLLPNYPGKDELDAGLNVNPKSNGSVNIALKNNTNITDVNKITPNMEHNNIHKENVNPSKEREKLYCVKNVYYKKIKEIGTGGSSKVLEVLSKDGKTFALKKVNLSDVSDTEVSMYRNEITFLEKMKGDKHIIKLYDWEFVNNNLFLVLEKGDHDLAKMLKKKKSLSREDMKKYWREMVDAVKTIHENGIVHADLKPANFILVGNMLKLIDFGIANGIQDNKTSATRFCQMGTLNYMSPEVIDQDSCRISKATDIWSLGCILYYMIYKKTPYSHIKNQYSRSMALQSGADINFQGIDDILLKKCLQGCLKYKKEERYTIQQLLEHPYLS